MITIFIDTSVLLAACQSKSSVSALIFGYSRKKQIKAFISRYVVSEMKRNAEKKLDQHGKQRLNFYLLQTNLVITPNPSQEEMNSFKGIIIEKDIPILAAAIKNKVNYLVTYDVGNFFHPEVREIAKPMFIVTPRHFVKKVMKF